MKKKAVKYTIFLLILPLIISIIISISTDGQGFDASSQNHYNSMDVENFDDDSFEHQIKNSSTFAYLSIFSLLIISCGVWLYIKKKEDF